MTTFSDLGLSEGILDAVRDVGYETPTPIQEQAIPYVLMGRDILGSAQTGTGKTASFTLPMIDILSQGRAKARMPRSLILEPTRELAAQVAENFRLYGKNSKLSMALLIGGESFGPQLEKLDRGVDVLIATPGRLIDHFERGGILLNDTRILVIDEADRMLDMGFIPDVERIVSFLPKIRQTLFFSATFPPEIRRLADAFLMNPKEISVSPKSSAAETVDHFLLRCPAKDYEKRAALRQVLAAEKVSNAIIFCNRKRDVDTLSRSLKRHGFSAAALHGDMAQASRSETLSDFKNGTITYLVATDVAGRGIDIAGLSHVFNYDVPFHAEDYIHRIGRTGRAGASGRAITLATRSDGRFVDAIQALLKMDIPTLEIAGIEVSEEGEDAPDATPSRKRGSGRTRKATASGRESKKESPRPARNREGKGSTGSTESRDKEGNREDQREAPKDAAPSPPSRPAAKAEPRPRRNPQESREESGPPVVGLGDHMPAFLQIEPLKPARKERSRAR